MRRLRAVLVAVVVLMMFGTRAATSAEWAALTPAEFIDTEGVNTHINYVDGAYRDVDRVIADLAYLGIRNIRDSLVVPGHDAVPGFDTYARVASAGIRFLLVVGGEAAKGHPSPMPSLFTRLAFARDLLAYRPGSVTALEGPNEINNWPITFEGLGPPHELEAALAFQRELYTAAHTAFPSLAHGLPVYYLTGYGAGPIPVGPDPLRVPDLANFNTQHPYPNHGEPPARALARARALPNTTDPEEPAVYTETGYSTNGGRDGVDADVQGKYTIDLLLDAAEQGIARTYIYELLDAYPTGSPQGNGGFGLFDPTGAPKPAARFIHAMNVILARCTTGLVAADRPEVTVASLPHTAHQLAFRTADGLLLALWDEPRLWDPALGTRLQVAPRSVDVAVASPGAWRLTLFDPEHGSDSVETKIAQTLQVTLGDHALFVRIERMPGG